MDQLLQIVYQIIRQESSVQVRIPKPSDNMQRSTEGDSWRFGEVVGSDGRGRLILFNWIYLGFSQSDLGRVRCADIRIEIKIMPDGRRFTLIVVTKALEAANKEIVRVTQPGDGAVMLVQNKRMGITFRRLVPRVRKAAEQEAQTVAA